MKHRGPRVQETLRTERNFQGRYKDHDIDLWREAHGKNWYIQVFAPSGRRACDGYWLNSSGKSIDEAIEEACVGACLWQRKAV